jgi:hypothetical protein
VARLTYAVLAFALGTLVTGFVVRSSSVPLLVSIGFSAIVIVLLLLGWSRRLRASGAFGVEAESDLDDLQIVEVDDVTQIAATVPSGPSAGPSAGRAASAGGPATTQMPVVLIEPDDAEEAAGEPGDDDASFRRREPAASKKSPAKRTPAAAAKAAARKAPAGRAKAKAKPKATAKPKPSPKVFVIPGRERFHARGCRFAKGDDVREVTEAIARRRGYVPCSVCKPGSS